MRRIRQREFAGSRRASDSMVRQIARRGLRLPCPIARRGLTLPCPIARRGLTLPCLIARRGVIGACIGAAAIASGCVPRVELSPRQREIAAAAAPILNLDPDVIWADAYNRLLALAPDSVVFLAEHPVMTRPCAPDELGVMVHVGLLRMLLDPRGVPPLSANCLETTLDLLHFDVKIDGESPGPMFWPAGEPPARWHDLFPAEINQARVAGVDVNRDRERLRAWWRENRFGGAPIATRTALRPDAERLWRILGRRHADRWSREHDGASVILCAAEDPPAATLHFGLTRDYNLVRAACLWLGKREEAGVRDKLIDLVGHGSPIVAYNARFALRYSGDARIRRLLDEFDRSIERTPRKRSVGM